MRRAVRRCPGRAGARCAGGRCEPAGGHALGDGPNGSRWRIGAGSSSGFDHRSGSAGHSSWRGTGSSPPTSGSPHRHGPRDCGHVYRRSTSAAARSNWAASWSTSSPLFGSCRFAFLLAADERQRRRSWLSARPPVVMDGRRTPTGQCQRFWWPGECRRGPARCRRDRWRRWPRTCRKAAVPSRHRASGRTPGGRQRSNRHQHDGLRSCWA